MKKNKVKEVGIIRFVGKWLNIIQINDEKIQLRKSFSGLNYI
jgi:hypothetical protein